MNYINNLFHNGRINTFKQPLPEELLEVYVFLALLILVICLVVRSAALILDLHSSFFHTKKIDCLDLTSV